MRNIIEVERKNNPDPDVLTLIKRIGFQLIHDGIDQRGLRKLKDILKNPKTREDIFKEAESYCQPEKAGKKLEKKLRAEEEDELTPTRTIFNNSLDTVKAISESGEPIKLINRAIKNLEIIDPKHSSLKNSDSKKRLDLLYSILERILKNSK